MNGWKNPITEMFNGIIETQRKLSDVNNYRSKYNFESMFKYLESELYHDNINLDRPYTYDFMSKINLDDNPNILTFIIDYERAAKFINDHTTIYNFELEIIYNNRSYLVGPYKIDWQYPYSSPSGFRILSITREELISKCLNEDDSDIIPVYYYNTLDGKLENHELLCPMVRINFYKLIKELE